MNKYTCDIEGGDGLFKLLPEDDPATANWGNAWHTPTTREIDELISTHNCLWTWDAEKNGYIVKSLKTGNTIFLPSVGYMSGYSLVNYDGTYGYYMSSNVNDNDVTQAHHLYFRSTVVNSIYSRDSRYHGRTVRAVTE